MMRALLVVVLVLVILLVAWASHTARDNYSVAPEADPTLYGPLVAGMGPYHLQIYDVPLYYPYYKGSQQVPWDFDGKCSVSCTPKPGDPEKRCTVWCRA